MQTNNTKAGPLSIFDKAYKIHNHFKAKTKVFLNLFKPPL